jgi:phage-related holin
MHDRSEAAMLVSALVGAALGAAGHPIMVATIAAAFADLVTGLAKAWATGKVESNRLGRGLYKILSLLTVGMALVMIGRVSDASMIAANALAAAFLFREALSIVENLYQIGVGLKVDIPAISLLVRLLRLNEAKLLAEAGEKEKPDAV